MSPRSLCLIIALSLNLEECQNISMLLDMYLSHIGMCLNTGLCLNVGVCLNIFVPQAFFDFVKVQGKVHPCTGTEALYRPYGP